MKMEVLEVELINDDNNMKDVVSMEHIITDVRHIKIAQRNEMIAICQISCAKVMKLEERPGEEQQRELFRVVLTSN